MTCFNLSRIRHETRLRHLEYHDSLESTNQLAIQLLPDLLNLCPAVVLTADQTAGRGRGANSWWASTGALTFSLVLDPLDEGLSVEKLSMLSLAVGTAVRRALAKRVGGVVQIKWPNDILLNERKLCGILTEQHTVDGRPLLIVGVGVNVNNSLQSAPEDVRQRATSLFDSTGDSYDLTEVLIAILASMDDCRQQLIHDSAELLAELNRHSILNGRHVTVRVGDKTKSGVCQGINNNGSLMLNTPAGLEMLISGTVDSW